MSDINLDDANTESQTLALHRVVQKHHALVKVNRFLLMLVFALTVAVFVMGLILVPKQELLIGAKEKPVAGYDVLQNPVISAEINTLKGQMFSLVSGSIESKLRSLEENIKRGSLVDSLNTLHDLKTDVKVLSAYSAAPQIKSQDHAVNQQVIKELADLKSLIYLTVVSCGLMMAGLACVWLRRHFRLTHQKDRTIYLNRHE